VLSCHCVNLCVMIPDDRDRCNRCIKLWMHQNTLLWGRLQTLSALQVAVVGGWYVLFSRQNFVWALLLSALGTFLSCCVYLLIRADLALRKKFREELDEHVAPGFFPKHEEIPGWLIVHLIGVTFCILNGIMAAVSALMIHCASSGCCLCRIISCGH